MLKKYKIWSNDLGYPEEDAYVVSPDCDWHDMEDTVDKLITSKYSESWESPTGPFDMSACEIDDQGNKVGDVETFFIEVDWSPNFYISAKK